MRRYIEQFAALVLVLAQSAPLGVGPGTRPGAGQVDPARASRCATYARRQVETRGGGAVGGAMKGAAAGAVIGGIVDGGEGAGKGAAIGAGAGFLGGAPDVEARYRNHYNACMNAPAVP